MAENPTTGHISTHVLDVANGKPGVGVKIDAYYRTDSSAGWMHVEEFVTNASGRVDTIVAGSSNNFPPGQYRLAFNLADYFTSLHQTSFFPIAEVVFAVTDTAQHYHVPLTVSNFAYSTYRGA